MNAVLLTWNPGIYDDLIFTFSEWLDEMVVPHVNGDIVDGSWSVGRHVNNIGPGDVAYLFRQGECGRGIVARGIIQSTPASGRHWDPVRAAAGKTTNYVDVKWTAVVPTDVALELEDLEQSVPEFAWDKVYSSGRVMPQEDGDLLAKEWSTHIDDDYVQAYTKLYASDEWRRVYDLELELLEA